MRKNFIYKRRYRRLAQVGSLIAYNSYFFPFLKVCPTPGFNCYACPWAIGACPIGSLQHFMVIERIPFFLIGFFATVGGLLGRMICGWICPIGWLQEMLHKIPKPKLNLKKFVWLDKPARYLKYAVLLVLVLIIPYLTKEPWFSKLCFIGGIEAGIPLVIFNQDIREMIGTLFYIKMAITIITLIWFIFVKRAFCKYLCPLGAIYSVFNRFSLLRIHVDNGCTKCNRCQSVCPMDIKVYENPNSLECIRCLKCTTCAHVTLGTGQKKDKTTSEGVEIYV